MDTQVHIKPAQISKTLRAIAQFLLVSIVFGIAYTQDPIYYSPENQNTKYLHGLAQAGHGFLSQDWTANTLNPLPVFTALVQFTYQFIHPEYGFYVFYFLIFGVYVYSLVAIVSQYFSIREPRSRLLVFFALLLIFHTVNLEIFDFDLGWHLQAGVAMQYILGPVFQPCNFGVFLLLSIYVFLRGHSLWAVALMAIAVTFHPAYFPSVMALTLSYMGVVAWEERSWRKPLGIGLLSFVLVLPVFSYMYFAFQDTTPELGQQATDIIVNQRIPHHSVPAVWLEDGQPYVQTAVVAIALYLIRQTRLFYVLLLPFLAAVLLTVLQILIDSDTLAFMAPWRISVFLVPVATALILGQIVTTLFNRFPTVTRQRSVLVARLSLVVILTLVIYGGSNQIEKFQKNDGTFAMLDYVRATKQSGEVYLVPPETNKLRKFRLYTGAPIVVNYKTHPYLDVEVIEWNHRLEQANAFYDSRGAQSCRMLRRDLSEYGITHVVLPKENVRRRCKQLVPLYEDENYSVYSTEKLT